LGKLGRTMHAYRSAILYFKPEGELRHNAIFEEDGLLVVGLNAQGRQVVQAIGPYRSLKQLHPRVPVQHLSGRIIAPGFVDLHSHYPQTNVIGSPADGLLPWLENYTFPEEKRFIAIDYCTQAAIFFISEMLRNGVTTALTFATSHPSSVQALFTQAQKCSLRLDHRVVSDGPPRAS
jgi:guanine deaminase